MKKREIINDTIAGTKHIVIFWRQLMWYWSKKLSKRLSINLLKQKRALK
jgi:hypothetical protein